MTTQPIASRSITSTRAAWRRSPATAPVAQVGKLEFAGYFAWLAWLVLHLVYLVGYRNRIAALFAWGISFMGRARGQMAITSQMIYARLVMTLMEQQAQGALAAAEQAEHAEQEAAG